MKEEYNLRFYDLEKNNWWFIGRRHLVLKLIEGTDRNKKILDIGCANGFTMKLLERNGFRKIFGIDINKDSIENCKEMGLKNTYVMDALNLKFPKSSFDIESKVTSVRALAEAGFITTPERTPSPNISPDFSSAITFSLPADVFLLISI